MRRTHNFFLYGYLPIYYLRGTVVKLLIVVIKALIIKKLKTSLIDFK